MAFLGQTPLGVRTLLLTVLLGLSSTGEGFKQELWMYKEDGNALYFHTHVPDLAEYSAILPKITKLCANGLWLLSPAVNYQKYRTLFGAGGNNEYCTEINMTDVRSLRHFAANDTATDAISLYSGTSFEGDEIFTTKAKTDISIAIQTLAATGKADWMLFEGNNFDGNFTCYNVPCCGFEFNYSRLVDLKIATIGSVFKGCDLDEIQLYREFLLL